MNINLKFGKQFDQKAEVFFKGALIDTASYIHSFAVKASGDNPTVREEDVKEGVVAWLLYIIEDSMKKVGDAISSENKEMKPLIWPSEGGIDGSFIKSDATTNAQVLPDNSKTEENGKDNKA